MISKFLDSQNQPKSDFDAILLENRSFSGLGVNRKVVDNGLHYLNTDFQPNRDKNARENGQKPSKKDKTGLKWPKIC